MSNEHESIHMSDPCHPGEVLRDWINGHGKTVQEAANLMGVSRATLNRLLSGVGRIAPKLAVQLEGMWMEQRRDVVTAATGPRPCGSTACETGGISVCAHPLHCCRLERQLPGGIRTR